MTFTEKYDVVVVGAGHAGCEAAMAASRMGLKTALITMNMDLMRRWCNPAVGGVAKGHFGPRGGRAGPASWARWPDAWGFSSGC